MCASCSACGDMLPQESDFVKCAFGGCKLHYECSGVSEKTYRTMSALRRDNYKCRLCRNATCDDTNSAASSDGEAASVVSVSKPISDNSDTKTINSLFSRLDKMEKSLNRNIVENINALRKEVVELKVSVEYCSNKVDDFVKQLDSLNFKLNDVQKVNKQLSEKNMILERKVESLQFEVEQLQQYGRNSNIQLDGVPEVQSERIMEVVNRLAVIVDEPLVLNMDIQAAHRLPSKNTSRPRPIVVQFTNRQKRDAVLKKSKIKKMKSTDFVADMPETPVYVNEHLTPYFKNLLFHAKQIKKEKNYAYVWAKGSKIFIKKDENSKSIRLESLKDLEKL